MPIDITDVTRRVQYAGSGTGPYNFTFQILDDDDIAVYQDDTLLTKTTNYTVTINADGTGSITTTSSIPGSDNITIIGARPYARLTDFSTGGDFFADDVNDELDSIVILIQQLREEILRSLRLSATGAFSGDATLPTPEANALIGWNPAADGFQNYVPANINLAVVSTFMATVLDDATAADARTTLGFTGAGGTVATANLAANVSPWVLLDTETASSSATLDFTTGVDNTYDDYMLVYDLKPATDDVQLLLRVGTGAGPTWQDGVGAYVWGHRLTGPSSGADYTGTGTAFPLSQVGGTGAGVGNAAGEHATGEVRFTNPETGICHFRLSGAFNRPDTSTASLVGAGVWGSTTAITGLRLYFSSGNIASGTARLYGLRK